jgi:hypothetical protein
MDWHVKGIIVGGFNRFIVHYRRNVWQTAATAKIVFCRFICDNLAREREYSNPFGIQGFNSEYMKALSRTVKTACQKFELRATHDFPSI